MRFSFVCFFFLSP